MRISLGDPTHHKERGPHLRVIEQIKEGSRGLLNPRGQALPLIRRQRIAGAADMKPFLEIHGECVRWRATGRLPCFAASSGNHAGFLRRSAMMNEAIVSTECNT